MSALVFDHLKEVWVKGIVIGPGQSRPVLIMKGAQDDEVFPVWLSNMEFDSIDQANLGILKSGFFHGTNVKILKALGLKIGPCVFSELVGHHQYVDMHLVNEGGDTVKTVRANAEECLSLCMVAGSRFFVSAEIMDKSRMINNEILATNFEVPNHPYMM